MTEVKDIEIAGYKYQIHPITGRKALMLDRKASALVMDMFGKSSDKDGFRKAVIDRFGKMDESEFEEMIVTSTEGIVFCGGEKEKSIKFDSENIWEHFKGRLDDLYTLVMLAWEAYKLTPFARISKKADTGD